MSSEKIEEYAKEGLESEYMSDNLYRSQFTYIDKNHDSFVDMDEIFTMLETLSKRFTKKEFVASQMENISAIKRSQEQSVWSKPMDFEMFKSYWTLFFIARLNHVGTF